MGCLLRGGPAPGAEGSEARSRGIETLGAEALQDDFKIRYQLRSGCDLKVRFFELDKNGLHLDFLK